MLCESPPGAVLTERVHRGGILVRDHRKHSECAQNIRPSSGQLRHRENLPDIPELSPHGLEESPSPGKLIIPGDENTCSISCLNVSSNKYTEPESCLVTLSQPSSRQIHAFPCVFLIATAQSQDLKDPLPAAIWCPHPILLHFSVQESKTGSSLFSFSACLVLMHKHVALNRHTDTPLMTDTHKRNRCPHRGHNSRVKRVKGKEGPGGHAWGRVTPFQPRGDMSRDVETADCTGW